MNEFEFNTDNTQIGFRLDYMELLNWGTFNKRIWQISPKGNNSLLTGAIGSGKSTVVDALTCLIVPHQKITFNKAAGAQGKERTLASYIRGEYKNTKDEFSDAAEKRKGKAVGLRYNDEIDAAFSIILANFRNAGYSSDITLAQVFWIENDKVQKLLIISSNPLTIKETFENIEDAKSLKQRIKSLSKIEYAGDNFLEYSKTFMRLFGMNSENAIDLFYQTVSMKSVNSLTSFVREQMLEQTDVKTQIEDLKKRFDDLSKAYDAVKEVRKQRDILFPLEDLNKNYNTYNRQIEEIDNIVSAMASYFASKKITLLEAQIQFCQTQLSQLVNQLSRVETDLTDKNEAKVQIEQDIKNNGGARLEEIAKEIERRETAKTAKNEKYKTYVNLLSLCALPVANADSAFYQNLKTAREKIESLKERYDINTEKLGKKAADLRAAKEAAEKTQEELNSLRNRKNQIPLSLLDVRKQLTDDLKIDENEMPFVGELIKVKDEEKAWEGALERLLHGFGISLLVPEKYYRSVSGYINENVLSDKNQRGIKLDYFPVPQNFKRMEQYEIDLESAVNKIEIKNSSLFEDWLKTALERHFNLRCVSIDEFQTIRQDAITIDGQYKKGKKHTKDDRRKLWDRTKFILGWSNAEKIKAIEQELENNLKLKNFIDAQLEELKTEIKAEDELRSNLTELISYKNWNELNWHDEAKKIDELTREKFDIESSSDVLKSLQDNLSKVNEEIKKLTEEQSSKTENKGKIKGNIDHCNDEINSSKSIPAVLPEIAAVYYPKIDLLIEKTPLTFKNTDKTHDDLKNRYVGKNGEKDKLNKKKEETLSNIIKEMQNYKNEFPADAADLSAAIEYIPEFIDKYEKIITEGLPKHEERFKEMLKKNTIQDIRIFNVRLDKHCRKIKSKIDEINKHLKQIEFNKGTYIKLSNDNNPDKEILDFKSDMRDCYEDILDPSDAYTENRFMMVKKFLDRFMSNDGKYIEWTKKVTDVRNWFLFSANELYCDNDGEKEYYSDSAGKSGGQKEKLAYTILASALAYQFGLSYGQPRSKSFRFVVIDEAFGRGDDESAQFGLELFKKLNLQLLVITPFQKIHIIENYVNSVHIVSNTQGNNSEMQYLTIEEYKLEKQKRELINVIEETIQ
jgi:uncharacterized protein YPO0396